MNTSKKFHRFSREEWQELYRNGIPPLTEEELQEIKSLNDQISLQDVQDIYLPLTHLIRVYMKEYESLQVSKGLFIQSYQGVPPYVIGVAGSVAVGKSTTARLLQMMLSRLFKRRNVRLITTDGFLYPNAVLEERGIMSRKGFPESYDMERLIDFLDAVKSGKERIDIPVYSHESYDIVPDQIETIVEPDILIVEGINTLQLPANEQIYVSDFFDFSVYVDADPALIETWYLDRFGSLLDTAFRNPGNFYYPYAMGPREEAFEMAQRVWKTVNLKNLEEYILPTRSRADVILRKEEHHQIAEVFLRKY
ncbi:type I pantothenate kinase [Vagococcus lutrae]|uniref:Pantothenate kinase n=2 Tax=Vagococcus lutrae TaxID=81947 RepID=V6Q2M3_9ENTE|nr:type I pantothenate kinase [Vagococcus lutrae]MDO5741682.1 type I pantothenate kinase [Vagococcus sp.]EST89466.1 pantothenate kinase [Vagococcus lutrae LBD1]MCO7151324.1 type I pantothenate kinase [Vagococcus lutrae]MDT2801790.1 type I pantothenate kinase [Vagococcus lutrae]MDT2807786.1 type I pantothenate kinase [Vagococcus lutrae]